LIDYHYHLIIIAVFYCYTVPLTTFCVINVDGVVSASLHTLYVSHSNLTRPGPWLHQQY